MTCSMLRPSLSVICLRVRYTANWHKEQEFFLISIGCSFMPQQEFFSTRLHEQLLYCWCIHRTDMVLIDIFGELYTLRITSITSQTLNSINLTFSLFISNLTQVDERDRPLSRISENAPRYLNKTLREEQFMSLDWRRTRPDEKQYSLCFALFVEELLSYGRELSWVVVWCWQYMDK